MSTQVIASDASPSSMPGGTVSAIPGATSSLHTERVPFAGATLRSSSEFIGILVRTVPRIQTLRSVFSKVVVTSVELDLVVPKRDNVTIVAAAVSSMLTAPKDFAEACTIPSRQVCVTDSMSARTHKWTWDVNTVLGAEWDLGVEVVRHGHVALLVSHDSKTSLEASSFSVCRAFVSLTVECSGSGPGFPVGGASAF